MSESIAEKTVGQLLVEDPSRSRIFQKYGIDFCCGGKQTLADACRQKGLDPAPVVDELMRPAAANGAAAPDPAKFTLRELCDHIESVHHAWLKQELPRLSGMVRKVASVHGEAHPWTRDLAATFEAFADDLEAHMQKEERVLFPVIRKLAAGEIAPITRMLSSPIAAMEHEHEEAARALQRMRELSSGFVPPDGACNTFRAMLHGLAQLEEDMQLHVHKENNVLFPRAAALAASGEGSLH
ncbi:MAG TPA: iron-sulfur cluster repair di-iron protein [Vicinamibacterales bacterium]|nr:iron-sulfur cluster repair di-iron protein [Vicinamibacterales bacterium]